MPGAESGESQEEQNLDNSSSFKEVRQKKDAENAAQIMEGLENKDPTAVGRAIRATGESVQMTPEQKQRVWEKIQAKIDQGKSPKKPDPHR